MSKENGKSQSLKDCEHKIKVNVGTKTKLNIRCLRCNKKFTEKMHLYEGIKKYEKIRSEDIKVVGEGDK